MIVYVFSPSETASQSAELIADHFAAISMDYDPVDINNFPPAMS